MPELIDAGLAEIQRKIVSKRHLSDGSRKMINDDEAKKIVESHGSNFIGMGAETTVVAPIDHRHKKWWQRVLYMYDHRKDVVVALNYEHTYHPDAYKRIYYRHKIFSTLFPHNFPKFLSVFSRKDSDKYLIASIRQRIYSQEIKEYKTFDVLDKDSPHPFSDVNRFIKELNVPVEFDEAYDARTGLVNFVKGRDGGVYYLDRISEPVFVDAERKWDSEKIVRWMVEHKYPPRSIKLVETGIRKLQVLNKR